MIKKYHVSKNLLNISMDNSIVYSNYSQYTHYSITNQTITCEANAAAFFAIPFECGENETFTLSGTNTPFAAVRIRAYFNLPVARDDYYISPQVWSQTVYGSFTKTFITPTGTKYILIEIYHDPQYGEWTLSNFMVNIGTSAEPYEPYSSEVWHDIPYHRYETATETIQSGDTIYANGQPISTYNIKGNTVQSGTPTPSAPLPVNGVGVRTANLFDYKSASYGTWTNSNGSTIQAGYAARSINVNAETITISCNGETKPYSYSVIWLDINDEFISRDHIGSASAILIPQTFTPPNNAVNFYIQVANGTDTTIPITESQLAGYKIMLNSGDTALPYEPYGYKIPISSGGVTTNLYTAEPLMKIGDSVDSKSVTTETRATYKYEFKGDEIWSEGTNVVFISINNLQNIPIPIAASALYCSHFPNDNTGIINGNSWFFQVYGYTAVASDVTTWKQYLADQYAAGTPVTVWYQLATPTTETVTAPSIPTTEGANTITVDTTVQPSEFTATWTGWHDASVKEKSENLWNEDYTGISGTMKYNAIYVGDGEFTLSSNMVNNNYSYIFFLAGRPQSGASTGTNDVYDGQSRTVTAVNGYVTIAFRSTASFSPESYNTMLNSGSTALPYEPYWK